MTKNEFHLRMWALALALEHSPPDCGRDDLADFAQWAADWVESGDPGAAHEPSIYGDLTFAPNPVEEVPL